MLMDLIKHLKLFLTLDAASIEAKNKAMEAQLKNNPLKDLEDKISKQQMLTFDLDEREERLSMRQRLANKKA